MGVTFDDDMTQFIFYLDTNFECHYLFTGALSIIKENKQCSACGKRAIQLPRHCRDVHNRSFQKARAATNLNPAKKKRKDRKCAVGYRHYYKCPVDG